LKISIGNSTANFCKLLCKTCKTS